MTKNQESDSLSIGFLIYFVTQVMTFLSVAYILVYYVINDLAKLARLDKFTFSSFLEDYIFPQGFWIVFLPVLLLAAIIFVYLFIPLYNENIIIENSKAQYTRSLLYVDDKGKLYRNENLDVELPGVEDIMLFKVNERLYREPQKVFNDDPDWIVEDIYI